MITFVAILLLFQADFSQTQLQFDKGNQKLKEQDYIGTIKEYSKINTSEYESGALWLNLGLTYTQLDSLGKAKAYFLAALEFEETKVEAQKGLDYVIKRLPQKAASLPKLPWDYIFEWILALGSTNWSWLTLVSAYVSLILFCLYLFRFRDVVLFKRVLVVSVLLVIFFGAAAIYSDYVHIRYGKAVLITSQSNLNQSASNDSELVSLAFEGYEFTVDYSTSSGNQDWMYVRMSNGVYGWIKRSDILIF